MKKITLIIILSSFLYSCVQNTVQVGENTFVYKDKVFRLIDNELVEMSNLENDSIRKFQILKPKKKNLGTAGLSYVKKEAAASIDALYRGNSLYFNLMLINFKDLKESYTNGIFTIEFKDEYGFILHSKEITTGDLVGIVDEYGDVVFYQYSGKTEMSTEINSEIKSFSLASTVKRK